jgi:hypothetical protein
MSSHVKPWHGRNIDTEKEREGGTQRKKVREDDKEEERDQEDRNVEKGLGPVDRKKWQRREVDESNQDGERAHAKKAVV